MASIKIIIAGDLIPSEENNDLFIRGDAEGLFGSEVCSLFRNADFAIANLEGTLTDSTVAQEKEGPKIRAPKRTIAGIKNLGLSAVALANNHITDYLQRGCVDTLEALDEAGISYVGLVNDGADADIRLKKYLSLSLKGKRVCIYNVSETFFNQPSKDSLGANVYDEWIVLNEIKELKKEHDFLIVIYHGGAEYLPYPTPQTHTRFYRMAECGADYIVAQHTHCIGCEEWYKGSYLLHGQGNFLFARQKMFPAITKQGLVSEITITDNKFTVKNHIVNIEDSVIKYDSLQDFTAFNERSQHVKDEEYIISEYQKLKFNEIKNKYLIAAKGGFPFRRILNRLFPGTVRFPESTYTYEQVLRNLDVTQGERRKEDMFYVWNYIRENFKANKSLWFKL